MLTVRSSPPVFRTRTWKATSSEPASRVQDEPPASTWMRSSMCSGSPVTSSELQAPVMHATGGQRRERPATPAIRCAPASRPLGLSSSSSAGRGV